MADDIFNFYLPIDVLKSVGDEEEWIFEGLASTPHVDLTDEVVYPESFRETLDFFKENGSIFYEHSYYGEDSENDKAAFTKEELLDIKSPIGAPLDAWLEDDGLYIKAKLNKKHPIAQKMWNEYLTNPDEKFRNQIGLSIGARYKGVPRREYNVTKGKYVTTLPELLLYEVSMTPKPVNPNTRTWASVIKSMADTDHSTSEHHEIIPDEVVFDPNRNRLAIKSTIEGDDGKKFTFETYIDLKEDVKKAMDEENKNLPVTEEDEEVSTPEVEVEKAEVLEEETPAVEESPAAPLMDEALGEDVEAEEALGAEGLEAEAGLEAELGLDAEGDAGGILDALVQEDTPETGGAEMGAVLEKLDTLLDAVTTLNDVLQSTVGAASVGGAEVELVEDTFKSVEISQESLSQMGNVLKAVMKESLAAFRTDTLKSADVKRKDAPVVHPGVAVNNAAQNTELVEGEVRKSVESDTGMDPEVLKSLATEYVAIIGNSPRHDQDRAKVVMKAERTLGIDRNEFRQYVNKFDKELTGKVN